MSVNLQPRRFTVDEYVKMGDAGIFHPGEKVELIEGEIIAMSPQNPSHAYSTERLNTLLVMAFGTTHGVRVQLPLTLSEVSEPEPDFALVRLELRGSFPRHPNTADLVIEVAHSSLSFDRGEKASLYAKAGILDYWIVNLEKARLEVRRQPMPNNEAAFGWDYSNLQILAPGQTVSPLFSPTASFQIDALTGQSAL